MGFGKRWPVPGKGGSKFKAEVIERNGIKFPSKAEADRWDELCLAQEHGGISDLKRQVTFELEVNGMLITKYRADFTYIRGGVFIVEDKKGMVTPEFKLKYKLMKACLGIEILCTGKGNVAKDPLAPPKKKKKKLSDPAAPAPKMRMKKDKQTTIKF